MGSSVTVDATTFADEVIRKSYEQPVLVDFFAQWCGPCQMLKPMLEKLVKEYEFTLAKVDIDQSPELAREYGVEGVPDVRVVVEGQVMPGFVGVLPEPQLRQLLAQLNLSSTLEVALAQVRAAKAAGRLSEAEQLLGALMGEYPENYELLLEVVQMLIQRDRLDEADQLLSAVLPQDQEMYARAQALRSLLSLKRELDEVPTDHELDRQFQTAVKHTLSEEYEVALQSLLEIVERDRKYRSDGARKTMILVFDRLGSTHPLTGTYRRKLMSALY
ncbi:tetratricopeptide repeat protein [Leptolyngbya sp. AN02str]|uniref:tetratricopeptide repeat protein n=1 Tax=Leptolyngbya sp. AN02str TaxID=3423363 RepID=UPI003D312AA2